MQFVIEGLSPTPYQHLYGLCDDELARHGAIRYVADECPGYPDRVEMRDADVGETLLLVNHTSVECDTPFRATHAIFVREGAKDTYRAENQVPEVMYRRMLSLRGFDASGIMMDAALAKGDDIKQAVVRMFDNEAITHIDAHNAERGCFSGRIKRA